MASSPAVSLEGVTNWLNAVLEFGGKSNMILNGSVNDGNFREWLRNGSVLLTVMNILCAPAKAKRVNKGNNPMMTGSNFTLYKQGCTRKFHVNEDFDHDFLARGGNISPMLKNISSLSYAVRNDGPQGFNISPFGPQPKGVMRELTEAEKRAARATVPLASRGDIERSSANNTDMAGIVKVKGTDKHHANATDLNYGSLAQSSANNTDMAGIVKVKGTDKHQASGADLDRANAAIAHGSANNTDMAGIIKVQGTDHHEANASDLNYGSIAQPASSGLDSVGVLRSVDLVHHNANASDLNQTKSNESGDRIYHSDIVRGGN